MAENRSFEGELTKAISGSLVVGRVVVMAVAIAIASVAVYAFQALALIKVGWLFWLNYVIAGIGWVIGAYVVLAGMVSVCKMATARESGQSRNIFSGIVDIFTNLFVVFFATVRYLFWFAALLVVIWGLGFFGRIPEVGPVVFGIALGVVSLGAALWVAVHVAKFFGSALVLPGIIATTGQKGVSCFKESKRIINGQPIRLVKRFLSIGLVIVLFSFVVAQGIGFLVRHSGSALGAGNDGVLNGAPPMRKLPLVPAYGTPAPRPESRMTAEQLAELQQTPWLSGLMRPNVLPVVGKIEMGTAIGLSPRETGTRLAGAWIFGIELIVVLLVLKAIAANFFALAGLSTYQALKDEPAASITAPDIKVDLSKVRGSLGAVGAKFKEEMKEERGGAPKKG